MFNRAIVGRCPAMATSETGQGRPASSASTLKVQRSAVGSGSGRPRRVWLTSQLGRTSPFKGEGGKVRFPAHPRRPSASRRTAQGTGCVRVLRGRETRGYSPERLPSPARDSPDRQSFPRRDYLGRPAGGWATPPAARPARLLSGAPYPVATPARRPRPRKRGR